MTHLVILILRVHIVILLHRLLLELDWLRVVGNMRPWGVIGLESYDLQHARLLMGGFDVRGPIAVLVP